MRILLLLLAFFASLFLFAQSPEEKLATYATNYPQEKVVLQLSKPAYMAGEIIAYKAYVLSGYAPSDLSTNLYVELYDGERNRIDSQIIYLHKGGGDGNFSLPASLAENVYYIRAYTRWMLNFRDDLQYLKPIPIYNPYSSQSLRLKPVQWKAKAYIEGGQLIDSAVANVAIRLFGTGTLPGSWSGSLVDDETETTIASITVQNSEIGEVRFVSFSNKTYKLVLKDNKGNTQEIILPPVKNSGALLQVTSYDKALRYSILLKSLTGGGKGYKLVATYDRQPFFTSTLSKPGTGITGTIDISHLPPGLVHLTLFDEKSEPVSERLCFIHQKNLQLTQPMLTTDTFSVERRGYNHWQVVTDTSNWLSYNIQVSDASLLQEDDFVSDVHLTSDLSLPVHQANWYLNDVTDEKVTALQALLLTEENKPVHWPTVLRSAPHEIQHQPERFLSIRGTVLKGNKPQPLREMNLVVKAADSNLGFLQVKTDKEGKFVLEDLYFTDSLQVFYQPDRRKFLEGDLSILFHPQNPHHPLLQALPPHGYTLANRLPSDTLPLLVQKAMAERQQELLRTEKTKMLEAVVVTARIQSKTKALDERLSTELFKSQQALIFDFVNDEQASFLAANNVVDWLQGRVPGLTISYQDNMPVAYLRNQRVQLYLDEMSISSDYLQNISPADVAMIKVIQGGAMRSSGGGSIAIYTRRDDMSSPYSSPSLPHYTLTGYKRYTAPLPPTAEQVADESLRDDRTILYRHVHTPPDLLTGKTAIRFYNNDGTKKYRLIITGFTSEGQPVYLNTLLP